MLATEQREKRGREDDQCDIEKRLDEAINEILPKVDRTSAVIRCFGICGFYKTGNRMRIIVGTTNDKGEEVQVTLTRPANLSVKNSVFLCEDFFHVAKKWPKAFAVIGDWDRPFVAQTKSGDERVAMLNFSAKILVRPKLMTENDEQPMFDLSFPIGCQAENIRVPRAIAAWKVKIVSLEKTNVGGRNVTFTYRDERHKLYQYSIKAYDEQTLEEDGWYLLMGIKHYKDGFGNSSCCQFVSMASFPKDVWDGLDAVAEQEPFEGDWKIRE